MRGVAAALFALALPAGAVDVDVPFPLKGGVDLQSADIRAQQKDAFANPGLLWVARGERLWSQPAGQEPACSGCHGEAEKSMRGVAVRYPKHDAALGRTVDLEGRIRACVSDKQKAPPPPWESEELLALTAYVARQSAGMPIQVTIDGTAVAASERGRKLYYERQGQLNLACNQCHMDNWNQRILTDRIGQGHPADWPAYRLEWQSLGSLQRRLRACYYGVRAEQPEFGSGDLVALELYLARRAEGLVSSPPGVRK
jgi:sulfur-oxidizing protein SoxA